VSYLVLARKYRPQSFKDLVGQSHVATTLAHAIEGGRVAHAFLFTGVRGVGKTTSARLLAKCLNCLGADGKATGPTAEPCQVCSACKEIATGADIDVQEIDGASYNGVDEVRRLQEGIAFRPARDRYKIYIVDEVHMLSNAAWNAFLKTLEEPPPHVKFIFATTEVHKVPVTILSRCQRYDFKLIPTQTIAKRLAEVLETEKIAAEAPAIAVLAREAAGSRRDAMSLLDQVIAFSGDKLTEEDVARVLGVADRQVLHQLATALVGGDAAGALKVVDQLAQQGFDLPHVSKDVLRHLRNLVVAKVTPGQDLKDLVDLADEELKDVVELAGRADADDLLRLYQGFSKSYDDIVKSGQPRAALEMTLVRLARRPPLLPLDELLARLGELERRLATGASPPPAPRGGGSGGSRSATPSAHVFSAPVFADALPEGPGTRGALALAQAPIARLDETPAPAQVSPKKLAPPPPPAEPAQGRTVDLEAWRAILERVRAVRPPIASVLEHAVPLEVRAERLTLGYGADSILGAQAAEAEALDLLRREARAHFGGEKTQVALDLSLKSPGPVPTIAAMDAEKRRLASAEARAAVEKHPLVEHAVKVLGAELREVRIKEG
jgi:DNA polymerase-3 subunit gamma/tau